jgi:uncharacterized membrane protein
MLEINKHKISLKNRRVTMMSMVSTIFLMVPSMIPKATSFLKVMMNLADIMLILIITLALVMRKNTTGSTKNLMVKKKNMQKNNT